MDPSNYWYGFDFCPAYWEWLIRAHKNSDVFSTTDIRADIWKYETPRQKELLEWCNGMGKVLFHRTSYDRKHIDIIASWVRRGQNNKYTETAQDKFMGSSDPLLIAEAIVQKQLLNKEIIVVSREVSEPNSQNRVKIPDVCSNLGMECIQPYEMLRREQVRFVLN